jgi:hypothetical protein
MRNGRGSRSTQRKPDPVPLHSFIHQWLYSPLLGLGLFFSFVIFFYTVGRTPWTSDQPVARPLPTRRTTQTQNTRKQYRHPCLEWDSNPRSQSSSERTQFMPQTTHAVTVIATVKYTINKIQYKPGYFRVSVI